MYSINRYIQQADTLRFKLLGIVGKDPRKKDKIIGYLKKKDWTVVDVAKELLPIKSEIDDAGDDSDFELGTKIKDWFNSQPNNLILTNASILYHEIFLRISPVGAFKYNSRNKNCLIFLEDESRLGARLYYGEMGSKEYYDQEMNDVLIVNIADISDEEQEYRPIRQRMSSDSIGHLFNFHQIKDVVDIDADLKEQDQQEEIVSSYILSDSLEQQIAEFFEDLEKPIHRARTIIGNYGSGKSHLAGFLVSLIENPYLVDYVKSEKIQKAARKVSRPFFHVQFELQSGQVELKKWFYGKTIKQLSKEYGITIPQFNPQEDYDDKENIQKIIELVKEKNPAAGLLIVIDEISDFLASKQKEAMKSDLQFLRVIGQVCQDQDIMFVGSMQEDVFTSPKFKDVSTEIGRVGERFQNIIIHKEDVKKVISTRIVPKTDGQRHTLESKLSQFAEKIEPVSTNTDDYVDLFPLTPFLLDLFAELPYFEKRGVIQFAMNEIKYLLHKPFPYFITFEKIYDLLADNPNKRNLEEVYEIVKVMGILDQKINRLEKKHREDAFKIIRALAVYSLWDQKDAGAMASELANNLMMLPANKMLSADDYVSLIIKNIRDVTDGEYIKILKEGDDGKTYFRFETKTGVDAEEKIQQKSAAVSDSEVEQEIFLQLTEVLELERFEGNADVFEDECSWPGVKSFRRGYTVFVKDRGNIPDLEKRDYCVALISPFVDSFSKILSDCQINIKLHISSAENVSRLKEIVAIRNLISSNFQSRIMTKKLDERINGFNKHQYRDPGIRFRLAKQLINYAECTYNGNEESIKHHLGRESASIPEIIDAVKTAILNKPFSEKYPKHPVYSEIISGGNIERACSGVAQDLASGDYTSLSRSSRIFLGRLNLLNPQGFPDTSGSPVCLQIIDKLKANGSRVTDIEKDIVESFIKPPFGLEPEIVYLYLVFLTVQGKIYMQARGGDKLDINNIKEKFRSISQFENIMYAKLQENYSYDFAERLLNTLGLNGAHIKIEKERLHAFQLYKEKIAEILKSLKGLEQQVTDLSYSGRSYLDMDAVKEAFQTIQVIPWESLDIDNHTNFKAIEKLNADLPKIEIQLREIKEMDAGLTEYRDLIHPAIEYMDKALQLVEENTILQNPGKDEILMTLRDEVKTICKDYLLFRDRSQRNPIKGKIERFKKTYKYDVYIPAHDKYVGKQVDWEALENYPGNDIFKRLRELYKVTLLSDARFNSMILSWNELKGYKCNNSNLDYSLDNNTFCQDCLFPQKGKYTEIPGAIGQIEEKLEETYIQVEENILNLVREYRDNLQFLDDNEKKLINKLIEDKYFPDNITPALISAINNLLKQVDVVEIDTEKILSTLFPKHQMVSLEEFRDHFKSLEHDIKQDRDESEIRIKLK